MYKPLPVVDSRYTKQVARERRLDGEAHKLNSGLLSNNAKTIKSVNFPIGPTCNPSELCAKICYACSGHFLHTATYRKQLAVLDYFQTTPTEEAAARVYHETKANNLTYLRWCGSGDLVPEVVAVINHCAKRYKDLVNVIYSRKPDMINALDHNPERIVINVSLDAGSMELVKAITHPAVRYTYLRETSEDVPPEWTPEVPLEIVFQLHQANGKLLHDPRDCAVDANRMPVTAACQLCKRCFLPTPKTHTIYEHKYKEAA